MASDVKDAAGHTLVTAYAVKRPDGQWALLMINKDQENPHLVSVEFQAEKHEIAQYAGSVDVVTFGTAQYRWDPLRRVADPDGPALKAIVKSGRETRFELPRASIVVLRGNIQTASHELVGKKPAKK